MSYQFLQLEQRGQVAYVWLNRPELHNAFNTTVIEELHACFKQINTRDDIRVVVLAGRGKAFRQVPTSTDETGRSGIFSRK